MVSERPDCLVHSPRVQLLFKVKEKLYFIEIIVTFVVSQGEKFDLGLHPTNEKTL